MTNTRRDAAEWICAMIALAVALKILMFGDEQLGFWILSSPHISVWMVVTGWTLVFWLVGAFQLAALTLCHKRNPTLEGACGLCPRFPRCAANKMRRLAALQAAFAWIFLFFAYRDCNGAVYLVMAAAQLYLFSVLSPAPSWAKTVW
jgi:hypothetical protein